jgi:iron complex outermembrane receptor protein
MRTILSAVVGVTLALCAVEAGAQASFADRQVALVIESKTLADALTQWAQQSGLTLHSPDWAIAEKLTAPILKGTFSAQDALNRLLDGSPLTYTWLNERTVTIRERNQNLRKSESGHASSWRVAQLAPGEERLDEHQFATIEGREDKEDQGFRPSVPEILVEGSRILNMDIARSRDDVQPYTIFTRETITNSGAKTVEEFLRKQLTTSTNSEASLQRVGQGSATGAASSINLRGLGANQTLILVDGHRLAGTMNQGSPQQPDINGIPLAAIERIEVLSTTASGIYGGSATGGVVNVILRRDYSGIETSLTYGGTFDGGATNRQVDLSAGFNLEGGRTNVLLSGTYQDAEALYAGDRNFMKRARARLAANDANYFPDTITPPIGRTTNILAIPVFDFDTFTFTTPNLTLKNGTPLNSRIAHIPEGYAGTASDGGAALVAAAGRYNLDLANTAQGNGGARSVLLGSPTLKSANLTVRREFTPQLNAFVELGGADNDVHVPTSGAGGFFIIPSSSPNNPFEQDIAITTPTFGADGSYLSTSSTRRATGGVIVRLPHDWQVAADFAWSRGKTSNYIPGDLNEVGSTGVTDGLLDVLKDTNAFPVDFSAFVGEPNVLTPTSSTMKDATLRFAGPIFSLPAGDPVLSVLLEHRNESFSSGYSFSAFSDLFLPSASQSIDSLYVEAKVPLVSEANGVSAVHSLDLQLAGRYDKYAVDGANPVFVDDARVPLEPVVRHKNEISSSNPTIGVRYEPVPDLMLRASYSEGFLPPAVNQISAGAPFAVTPDIAAFLGLTDPQRGGEPLTEFLVRVGGNDELDPERSESWSAGIVLTPRAVPELRLSADWTRIRKTDNIAELSLTQQTIDDELLTPGLLTRAPAGGDGFAVGPITELDLRLRNVAFAEVEALDFALDYDLKTVRLGSFALSLAVTHLLDVKTQTTVSSPVVDNVGVAVAAISSASTGGGLEWKGNGSLTWSFKDWRVGWNTRYFDSYWLNMEHEFVAIQGSATVPSQIYHDAFVAWTINVGATRTPLSSLEIQLGIQNVFNKEPPVDVVGTRGFNLTGYSPWGDPRLASYYLTVRTAF